MREQRGGGASHWHHREQLSVTEMLDIAVMSVVRPFGISKHHNAITAISYGAAKCGAIDTRVRQAMAARVW